MNAPTKPAELQAVTLNLFQRINGVRKKIDYIRKDKSVSTGTSGSYKAVTHDQVTAMVREHMVDFGIVCYPVLVSSRVADTMDKDGKIPCRNIRYEATYDLTFASCDDPKDAITLRIESHAMDNQDKAPGKALSYAKKYAILKLFEIETGEDDESRYQENGFDLLTHMEALTNAPNKQVLEFLYLQAKEAAMAANDSASFKLLGNKVKELLPKFKDETK